jgi:hypothetical protein
MAGSKHKSIQELEQALAAANGRIAELELKVSEECQPSPAELVRAANEANARAEKYRALLDALLDTLRGWFSLPSEPHPSAGPDWVRQISAVLSGSPEIPKESPSWSRWTGPCSHGRDPWDRCDTCEEAGELQALAWRWEADKAALAAANARAGRLEKVLTRARGWVSHPNGTSANCGPSGVAFLLEIDAALSGSSAEAPEEESASRHHDALDAIARKAVQRVTQHPCTIVAPCAEHGCSKHQCKCEDAAPTTEAEPKRRGPYTWPCGGHVEEDGETRYHTLCKGVTCSNPTHRPQHTPESE